MTLELIRSELERLVDGNKIIVLDEVGSTMDEVKRFVDSSHTVGFNGVVVALSQISGRGRQGRSWISARGDGVYLSAIFRTQFKEHSRFGILPLLVGLELKKRFESISRDIQLKWPNDIIIGGKSGLRKLGGVLLETTPEEGLSTVTIGVGINLRKVAVENAVSLDEVSQKEWSASEVSYLVLDAVLSAVARVEHEQIKEFIDRYNASMVFLNQLITFYEARNRTVSGICRGIDKDGSLLLETSQGVLNLYSGDVHQVL